MKKGFLIFALAVVSLLLETREFFGVRVGAAALMVYSIGLRYGPTGGLFFGAGMGAVIDVLSGGPLGPGIIGKALVGYLAPIVPNAFFAWTPLVGLISAGALTALDKMVSLGTLGLLEGMPVGAGRAAAVILAAAALNSLAGPFIKPGQKAK